MLLDPPDPVDLLIARTQNEDPNARKTRPLDFVRAKFYELKKENKKLKERVLDLEQTLSIVQTAQEWTMGKGMTPEQVEKMRDIKALLEQARKAREELTSFSGASRAALYEKLRIRKAQLRREREEKREMKERLVQAFDHARAIKEKHGKLLQMREDEHEKWQEVLKEAKERHRRELRRLQGEDAVLSSDRQDHLSHFGEHVIGELTALQQHLRDVRQETVDAIVLEGKDFEDDLFDPSGAEDYEGADPAGEAGDGGDDGDGPREG